VSNFHSTKRLNDTKQILFEQVVVQRSEMSSNNRIAHEFFKSVNIKADVTLFKVLKSGLEFRERSVFMGISNRLHGVNVSTLILLRHLARDDI
jgi:hypothetical protein